MEAFRAAQPAQPAQPALVQAAESGDADAVMRLLPVASPAVLADALVAAKIAGHADVVDLLLGADALAPALAAGGGRDGAVEQLLFAAAAAGHAGAVDQLLAAGADPNAATAINSTPLLQTSDPAVADLLLAAGADPWRCDHFRNTPLLRAADDGNAGMAAVLLGHDATLVNKKDHRSRSPLFLAVQRGDVGLVGLLLDAGAHVDLADGAQRTPLHVAAMFGHLECAELLVAAGADINAQNAGGYTATHYCLANERAPPAHARTPEEAAERRRAMLQLLIAHGADMTLCTSRGHSPLFTAATYDRRGGVVADLCAAGADVAHEDTVGQSALSCAVQHSALEVIRELVAAGADVTQLDHDHYCPLTWAVVNQDYGALSVLLAHCAPDAVDQRRDHTCRTALYEAGLQEDDFMIDALLEAGADPALAPVEAVQRHVRQRMRVVERVQWLLCASHMSVYLMRGLVLRVGGFL